MAFEMWGITFVAQTSRKGFHACLGIRVLWRGGGTPNNIEILSIFKKYLLYSSLITFYSIVLYSEVNVFWGSLNILILKNARILYT